MPQYRFSNLSLERIYTVSEDLQRVISRAMSLQVMDFTVICGIRTMEEQRELVSKGFSRTLNSRHLPNLDGLSEAIDIAPYPIDWNDTHAFHRLAGVIQAAAAMENVKIRWGGDWDGDNDTRDQSFIDLPHFELKE